MTWLRRLAAWGPVAVLAAAAVVLSVQIGWHDALGAALLATTVTLAARPWLPSPERTGKGIRAMPPRKYTSKPAPGAEEETISTEGIGFELDDVPFTCHGEFDANDLVDLAPLMDAQAGNWFDVAALAAVGHFYAQIMGPATYRAFQAHRRVHRTPPSVVAEIMMGLIGELTSRPPGKRSPSPGGPQETGDSSPAASPSPASPELAPERAIRSPARSGAVDPEGIIPPEWADDVDVVLAAAPAAGAGPDSDPMAMTHRTVNLGNPERTRVEPLYPGSR